MKIGRWDIYWYGFQSGWFRIGINRLGSYYLIWIFIISIWIKRK
jgi:hypothetical protein